MREELLFSREAAWREVPSKPVFCSLLGRLYSFAEKLGFVSGYRFGDTASPSQSIAPLGG
jgi:hypothetical protein